MTNILDRPNPVLKKLGFNDDDRVVVIHADDIGMCHATVPAHQSLVDFGILSSAATMVPCPWFLDVAAYCRENPAVDMGVHLTLTSEWDGYRWGPISTRDSATGLLDDEGYFHHRQPAIQEGGDLAAVEIELETQIQRAADAGVDFTHIDTHMFAVMHHKYIPVYLNLARKYQVPPLFLRWPESDWMLKPKRDLNAIISEESAAFAVEQAKILEEEGVPLFDDVFVLKRHVTTMAEKMEEAKAGFENLKPGLTIYLLHPMIASPETDAVVRNPRSRVADYEVFASEEMRGYLENSGIHVIGFRALRDLMRG